MHIAQGFPVWRNGQLDIIEDGLLIRMAVANSGLFFPKNISPPLFVLGDSVGLTLLTMANACRSIRVSC
ncbi:hypothetical protein [Corallococcus exiguus]|uniref:Uncharacterized protein n=1 Tax=Corallococcus exiguus TaxID=83462 RepID=A0A7X5BXG6_9BACT|nr:hypothetical protein [Corallococcus exiguus]NBC44297.1 hypothetical protein [Corallococcus exiguus]TNV60514.1 hypothetical protein FH620_24145 [Corallococcus exiguus]